MVNGQSTTTDLIALHSQTTIMCRHLTTLNHVHCRHRRNAKRLHFRTENTGLARLSIDIITEQGGKLSYWILPSVGASLDVVRVLVNDVVAFTYSNVESDWITQEVTIQPGKREVKFELQKNPDALSVV